jgi:hypothetical protein
VTAFDGGATSALALDVGHNGATTDDADSILDNYEVHVDATEVMFGDGNGAGDRVLQQAEAQASPLIIQIHCKPGQNDQWNRVLAHAFAYALRRLQGVDLPHGQAEITGYPFAITRHKGSRRATALRLDCMTLQPERERSIAAIKILQAVRCAERLGRRQTH